MLRRIGLRVLSVVGTLFHSAFVVHCQNAEIVETRIRTTQTLSGTVRPMDPKEMGLEGVLVEDCSPDWKQVVASTRTDGNGHFSFPNANKKNVHYLRFSMPGINTSLIKAKITPSGDKELSIVLNIVT